MKLAKPAYAGIPPLVSVPPPRGHHFFVAVEGRNRRPEKYTSVDAASKAAQELARYCLNERVVIYRAGGVLAWKDAWP
jgi:hypothetical protein